MDEKNQGLEREVIYPTRITCKGGIEDWNSHLLDSKPNLSAIPEGKQGGKADFPWDVLSLG